MKFQKRTEEELLSMNLLEPGEYPFEVVKASDTDQYGNSLLSKSGNEMISLTLKIWDENNSERFVFDYLLEALAYKIKHFCDATGLQHKYDEEILTASDCLGKSGYLKLIIQKDKTGKYKDKNAVVDYLTERTEPINKTEKKVEEEALFNDEIPF